MTLAKPSVCRVKITHELVRDVGKELLPEAAYDPGCNQATISPAVSPDHHCAQQITCVVRVIVYQQSSRPSILLLILSYYCYYRRSLKPPRILDGHSIKQRNYKISHKNYKHPAINPTILIIIVTGSIIFSNKLPTSTIMKHEPYKEVAFGIGGALVLWQLRSFFR